MPPARYAARKPQADAAHGLPASANYEFSPESALESASAHTLHAELAIAEKVVHTPCNNSDTAYLPARSLRLFTCSGKAKAAQGDNHDNFPARAASRSLTSTHRSLRKANLSLHPCRRVAGSAACP